jgi:multiple sugar transport system permease protein/raffinose/stachyose/melibiose transport system permease protein
MNTVLGNKRNIVILCLPAMLLLVLFVIYPLFQIGMMSFQKTDGLSPTVFYGFANYRKLFGDEPFIRANLQSIGLCFLAIVFNAMLGVFIAILLNGLSKKAQKIIRTTYILPMVLSVSVISQLWLSIYHADWGLLNTFLRTIGLSSLTNQWLINPNTAMLCVAIVGMWWMFGMDLLLAFSGIKAIPETVYEAAELDGCSFRQMTVHITLPLIKNITLTCVIISATGGLFTFPQVYIMTGGGPGDLTQTIMMYMYRQAFSNQRYGLGAAVAVIAIIEMSLLLFGIFWIFKKIPSDE